MITRISLSLITILFALVSCGTPAETPIAPATSPSAPTYMVAQPTQTATQPSPTTTTAAPDVPTQAATQLPSIVTATTNTLLASIRTRGGLCPYGSCRSEITIERDGTHTTVEGIDAPTRVKLNQRDVDALAQEIETADFNALKSRRFTGECPTAYDGQEAIFTFYPASGPVELATCTVVIDRDAPLFVTLQEIVAKATPQ